MAYSSRLVYIGYQSYLKGADRDRLMIGSCTLGGVAPLLHTQNYTPYTHNCVLRTYLIFTLLSCFPQMVRKMPRIISNYHHNKLSDINHQMYLRASFKHQVYNFLISEGGEEEKKKEKKREESQVRPRNPSNPEGAVQNPTSRKHEKIGPDNIIPSSWRLLFKAYSVQCRIEGSFIFSL